MNYLRGGPEDEFSRPHDSDIVEANSVIQDLVKTNEVKGPSLRDDTVQVGRLIKSSCFVYRHNAMRSSTFDCRLDLLIA
jgi:hypothetical protein